MTVNPHIEKAILLYRQMGRDFHEVLSWHLLHGVVMAAPEFLCLAYYCQNEKLLEPLAFADSDTGFVSFMAGDMAALKAVSRNGLSYIAFERGFKNAIPAKVYRTSHFLSFIK